MSTEVEFLRSAANKAFLRRSYFRVFGVFRGDLF
jgi:hypothetical protein